MAVNSTVSVLIGPKFKLKQDFIHVLVTCKFQRLSIATEKYSDKIDFRRSGAASFVVNGPNWREFKFSQSCMPVNVTCVYCIDWIKQVAQKATIAHLRASKSSQYFE